MNYIINSYKDFKDLLINRFTNEDVDWLDQVEIPAINTADLYIPGEEYEKIISQIISPYYPEWAKNPLIKSIFIKNCNTKFNFIIQSEKYNNYYFQNI